MITLLIVLWVAAGVLAAWLASKFLMNEYEAVTVYNLLFFIIFGGLSLLFVMLSAVVQHGFLDKAVFKGNKMAIYKTVSLNIYDAESDQSILVTEDGDGLGMVCVKSVGKDADYYGKLDFSLDADVAEVVANAILEQVKYIRETHK